MSILGFNWLVRRALLEKFFSLVSSEKNGFFAEDANGFNADAFC